MVHVTKNDERKPCIPKLKVVAVAGFCVVLQMTMPFSYLTEFFGSVSINRMIGIFFKFNCIYLNNKVEITVKLCPEIGKI